jgi:putative Holliday junction resolvase
MSDWVRALGIDHGTVRIGVAASDDIGLLAHPVETVPGTDPDRAAARIAEIARARRTEHLVIGLPLHLNGEEGEAVARVRAFVERLRPLLPDSVAIHEVDESLSTVAAMEKLRAAGRRAKDSKAVVDQAAAVEILQSWLDARTAAAPSFDPSEDPHDPIF